MAEKLREKRVLDPTTNLDLKSLENIQSGKLTKANKSGIRGVHWHKTKQKWIAYGRMDGRLKELGAFDTKEEAREAREKFVKKNYPAVKKNSPAVKKNQSGG